MQTLSRFRLIFGVDDGYDLTPYLIFLTDEKSFRPGQLKAIRAALSGKDVLLVAPTGSGKSVCYQLPGLLSSDPALVVSPLKALMKDQVESIWSRKIPATYINSDISQDEKNKRYEFIREHLYKFIFVAPERFDSKDPKTASLYSQYSHLVIDEAHEIEMWGMAFRPSYRKLGGLRKQLNNPPLIALTATASKETQDHILKSLNSQKAEVIVTGFYRKNIHIKIHRAGEIDKRNKFIIDEGSDNEGRLTLGKYAYIKKIILENPGQKILIFVATVKNGEELLESLSRGNIKAEFYHSKLDSREKMQIQNRFSGIAKPNLYILISTSAFGMGIDIANIRHVIHLSMPLSITDYTQQIGRAGRDELQSYAHLLYHKNDNQLLYFMSGLPLRQVGFAQKHGYSAEDIARVKEKLQKQVEDMLGLLNQPEGKEWQYILDYFGETPPSFWEKRGRLIIDLFLSMVIILTFIGLVWIVKFR